VESKTILAAYGVPVVRTRVARTPEEVAQLAGQIGGPVAVKILSPQLSHKSDVGGVRLDVTPAAAAQVARDMAETVRSRAPDATLTGFAVEPMIRRPGSTELLLGLSVDQTFGPVVLFGQGGTAAEAIGDRAVALPPLNLALARQLIARTRVYRLLQGFRERPPAALDAIASALLRLSEIAIDIPEIVELDINPLVADDRGVIAIDARIGIRPAPEVADRSDRLAIRPYPTDLETIVEASGSGRIAIRPITPQDEGALSQMVLRSTLDDSVCASSSRSRSSRTPWRRASRRSTTIARWRWWRRQRTNPPRFLASRDWLPTPTTTAPNMPSWSAPT